MTGAIEWSQSGLFAALWVIACGAIPLEAAAQLEDECIRNQFQVQVVDRDVVAFGSGTSRSTPLEAGEQVEGRHAAGCVAAVTTNRRFLFTSSRLGGNWYSSPLELNELTVADPLIGNTIVALATNRRFFGFNGLSGRFATTKIRLKESIVRTDVGANIAVVVTDQRLLGFSLGRSTIQEFPLHVREDVESVEATSDVVTVSTSKRVLFFGTSGGGWSERLRELH
jgi:hypothetical protein